MQSVTCELSLARRGWGAAAMSGGLAEQVSGVDREVGVREQI
jgi:hypothetical protein